MTKPDRKHKGNGEYLSVHQSGEQGPRTTHRLRRLLR